MKFYSGFTLNNESHFFQEYISDTQYTICGFSYGAIKALASAKERLEKGERVETLQLFSPAFFQTKEEKFKRLQLLSYKKDSQRYIANFLQASFAPFESKVLESNSASYEELEELLGYVWKREDLEFLVQKGVTIEVYLGGNDGIIDVVAARRFFLPVATVTYIKKANHFLQID